MCASYTFPKIFGKVKGFELVVRGVKLSSQEAINYKFVN